MVKKFIMSHRDWISYESDFYAHPNDDYLREESYWVDSDRRRLRSIVSISGGISTRDKIEMKSCFQCGALLDRREESSLLSEEDALAGLGDYYLPYGRTKKRQRCPGCGWWLVVNNYTAGNTQYFAQSESFYCERHSIVTKYDVSDSGTPIEILREHLVKHGDDIVLVDPKAFEILVGAIYRDFYEVEVRHVGRSGDGGVDLYAMISDQPHMIQVKRRSDLKAVEPVATVREFLGALVSMGSVRGHVVTTADHFSRAAHELVENENLQIYHIDLHLVSRAELLDMLSLTTMDDETWLRV